VSPERRRRAASHLQGRFGISERKACRLTSQHRSSQRYRRVLLPEEAVLRERLRLLARRHPRYGYRRIHAILRREGWACNRKRVQRLWRDEGLRLPAKARRRRHGPRMPGHLAASCPDQVWAIDFVSDRTADGRPLKILTVTDEHTREALATPAARRMGADETVEVLEQIVERRGRAPELIRYRQRPRVHQPSTARLVPLQQHPDRLHRTRRTLAESVRRILRTATSDASYSRWKASTPSTRPSCCSTTGGSSTTTTDPTNPSTT